MNSAKAPSRLWRFAAAATLLAALWPGRAALAAPPTGSIALLDQRFALSRLAPGQTHAEVTFVVDTATVIELDAVSSLDGVTTSVVAPDGRSFDESTAASVGGVFSGFQGAPADSPLATGVSQVGFHHLYRFPSLGPGTYLLRLDAPGIAEQAAVITSITTNSAIVSALLAPNPEVVLGSPVVLTAALFTGSTAVAGASVAVTVRDPNGAYSNLALVDDGAGPDNAAGDGLYSGELTPTVAGTFSAVALINGSSGGAPFVRQPATRFQVVVPTSALLGPFDDNGVDDNGDGLFDRVQLRPQVDTVVPGTYQAIATLRSSSGRTLVRSGNAMLPAGASLISIDFEAAGLRTLAEDGPYEVVELDLFKLDASGAIRADHREHAGFTRGYLLSQFQRAGLALTGTFQEEASDPNGNGKFDLLTVQLEVDVLRAGFYQWNAKLTAGNLTELDFDNQSGFLAAGLNTISLVYDGHKIGPTGQDGPFLVRDLLMFGQGESLVASQVAVTRAYTSGQFEGGTSSATCRAVKVGEAIVQPADDSGNANFLAAQPIEVTQPSTLESLSIFVSAASGGLRLALYDASGPSGRPGTLLAETDAVAATTGWNTIPVNTSLLLAPGTYWVAFLPQSNALHTPVTRVGPTFNVYRSVPFGPMPASFGSAISEPGHWSIHATVVPVLASTAPVCGTIALGEPHIQALEDSGNKDFLLSQPHVLEVPGTLQSLSLYVTRADGTFRMGVYDASGPGGGPGLKLAETAELTATLGWNTAPVTAPIDLAPGTYWLTYSLSSGTLRTRTIRSGPTFNVYFAAPYGPLPASFPTAPIHEPGHWSIYATLATAPQ